VDGFTHVHRERVRFRDCDAFGHVNNAVYLTYLEQARMSFLERLGLGTSVADLTIILARAEIDFRSQVSLGDEVEIGVRTARLGTKSFTLAYELRVEGRVVAEASTVLVGYDYERDESIVLPGAWREAFAA
jgi:acyl-CoA thioester hydrolase